MGDEIDRRFFDAEDFSIFRSRLDEETALLRAMLENDEFSRRGDVAGFELEVWLVDDRGDPLPQNDKYLKYLNNPLVVPELAEFNVELNGSPSALRGRVFSRLHDELDATWRACREAAEATGCHLVTIGILPTVSESDLSSDFMSHMVRYQSLNDRVMALRDGKPLALEIEGDSTLSTTHPDVMLEAAATSFQIHLQCRPEMAVRDFNASIAASAPIIAASANSPYLFGHALWDETRIPLFEQAVDVGPRNPSRVSFGQGYVKESLLEIFEENQREHLILIPAVQDSPPHKFSHVRFHNGTLWRWNRPLIGFDHDGQVHLRIEHRVVPAGPTIKDCIANSAFYFGLVRGLGLLDDPVEASLPFDVARDNFYTCARYGLNARVRWIRDGGEAELSVRSLIIEDLLPLARRGLQSQGIPDSEIEDYLDVIAARVDSGQNGAAWQRRWVAMNGPDLHALVSAYRQLQDAGQPVHTWAL
ncbi:MAG: glutamate--cysteine ligase [Gammaproteobacteria bacterium]|nr:glutamate--cysteine ligase [Gammaproteobacteria bacterium]